MGHYKSNLRDLEFNLFEVFGRQEVLGKGLYADVDVDAAKDILHEVARLAENELAEACSTPTATRRSTTRRPSRSRCPTRSRSRSGPTSTPTGATSTCPPSSAARSSPPRCGGRSPR